MLRAEPSRAALRRIRSRLWWDAMAIKKWRKGSRLKLTEDNPAITSKKRFVLDPIDFMLEILSDPSYGLSNRKWAAVQVAPYVRSKMPVKVDTGPPVEDVAAQLRQELAAMDAVTRGVAIRPRTKLLGSTT